MQLEKPALKTILYFSCFKYPPAIQEIHKFLEEKTDITNLEITMEKMIKEGKIINKTTEKDKRYTLPQYKIFFLKQEKRYFASIKKIKKIKKYIELLKKNPFVNMLAISGSVSMKNAEIEEDIDIFIITKKNKLWLGRLTCIMLAEIIRIRRQRTDPQGKDKVCLNLFFDSKNLEIPILKKTNYTAHEILQMNVLIDKNNTYEKFMNTNSWVYKIFPNAKKYTNLLQKNDQTYKSKNKLLHLVYNYFQWLFEELFLSKLEKISKKIQLISIKKNVTSEIIEKDQLWFFPHDYEKTVENKLKNIINSDKFKIKKPPKY